MLMKIFMLLLEIIAKVLSVLANAIKISEWWRQSTFASRTINWPSVKANVKERVNQLMMGLTIAQAVLLLITLALAVNIYWQQMYDPHMEAWILKEQIYVLFGKISGAIGLIILYTICNWRLAKSSW
jgi:hypothetical protein